MRGAPGAAQDRQRHGPRDRRRRAIQPGHLRRAVRGRSRQTLADLRASLNKVQPRRAARPRPAHIFLDPPRRLRLFWPLRVRARPSIRKGEQTMSPKDVTLELVIRYGFQVLGAVIILVAGVLAASWIGKAADRALAPHVKDPPTRRLM